MKIEHLSTDEILRTCEPKTELEKVLFARFENMEDEVKEARNDLHEAEEQIESWSCEECPSLEDQIDELESTVKALRALLDENDIDHSEI